MKKYELVPKAVKDLMSILGYTGKNSGREAAFDLEEVLSDAFSRLADYPGLGHKRHDLTSLELYFYTVDPYLIVYRRAVDPLQIVGVLHTSRDVKRLLQTRK